MSLGPQYRFTFFKNNLNLYLTAGIGLANWNLKIKDNETQKETSNDDEAPGLALPHGLGLDIKLLGPLSLGARVMNNFLKLHPDNQYLEVHYYISLSQILDP